MMVRSYEARRVSVVFSCGLRLTRTVFRESGGAAPLNSFFHIHKVFCNKVQVSLRGHYVSSLSCSVSCVCSTLVLLHLKLDWKPVHLFQFFRCQTKEKGCEDRGSRSLLGWFGWQCFFSLMRDLCHYVAIYSSFPFFFFMLGHFCLGETRARS